MIQNLEYYKVFYYVARNGSLTLAADELAVSQPAVSQSVKQLEKLIGTKLFYRVSKGVRLTKEGEMLYQHVKKGYEQIRQGEEKLRRMLDLELGEIRIGASDMTLQFYLLPFLEKYHERYPRIKVLVSNATTPEILQLLKEGKIDFGVVSSPFEEKPNYKLTRLKEIEDIFIGGRKFLPYKNKTLDFKELEKIPLIFLEGNTSTRNHMEAFLRENEITLQPEFELATSDMIVQFTLRNLGVGCVMREFAKAQLQSGKLFEFRFNKIIPKRYFYLVSDEDYPVSAAARNLLQMIYEAEAGHHADMS